MAASTANERPRLVTLLRSPLPPGFVSPKQYGHEQTSDDDLDIRIDEDELRSIRDLQKEVQKIIDNYDNESGSYEDIDFMSKTEPPTTATFSMWKRPTEETMCWMAPRGHAPYPWSLYRQTSPTNVFQGRFEDCWLVNAMCLLSFRPSLLRRIIVNPQLNAAGVYGVRLFISGQWISLIIDDQFPCNEQSIPITSWTSNQQLWPTIVEKAVAKAYGGYKYIDGGTTSEALKMLTGYCTRLLWTDRVTPQDMFKELESELQYGSVIGIGTGEGDQFSPLNPTGFPRRHAFALMATYSYLHIQLLCIRNVHGENKYIGRGAPGSEAWNQIPPEFRPIDKLEGQDQATLWIDMDELYRYFIVAEVCYVRPDWHSSQQGLMFPTPHLPLCYVTEIEVNSYTKIHLQTMQQNAQNRATGDIDALIVAFDEEGRFVYISKCSTSSTATWFKLLGEGRFKIICLSFTRWRSDNLVKYSVICDSSRPIRMYESPMRIEQLKEIVIRVARDVGEVNQMEGGSGLMTAYIMKPDYWYGRLVVAINEHPSRYFYVKTTLKNEDNIKSTRGTPSTTDVIAPRRAQVLNILTGTPQTQNMPSIDHEVLLGESYQPMRTYQGNIENDPAIGEREVLHNPVLIPGGSN